MDASANHLLFHGVVILLISLLAGIPYGRAILLKKPESVIHAWRVAHSSLAIGAVLMFALAAVYPLLQVTTFVKQTLAVLFIASNYFFAFALIVGPIIGARGLSPKGGPLAKAVYFGNHIGALGSLVGTFVLLYAAYVSL